MCIRDRPLYNARLVAALSGGKPHQQAVAGPRAGAAATAVEAAKASREMPMVKKRGKKGGEL
eukprot:9960879-Prorocentrum_lima.AAC.1